MAESKQNYEREKKHQKISEIPKSTSTTPSSTVIITPPDSIADKLFTICGALLVLLWILDIRNLFIDPAQNDLFTFKDQLKKISWEDGLAVYVASLLITMNLTDILFCKNFLELKVHEKVKSHFVPPIRNEAKQKTIMKSSTPPPADTKQTLTSREIVILNAQLKDAILKYTNAYLTVPKLSRTIVLLKDRTNADTANTLSKLLATIETKKNECDKLQNKLNKKLTKNNIIEKEIDDFVNMADTLVSKIAELSSGVAELEKKDINFQIAVQGKKCEEYLQGLTGQTVAELKEQKNSQWSKSIPGNENGLIKKLRTAIPRLQSKEKPSKILHNLINESQQLSKIYQKLKNSDSQTITAEIITCLGQDLLECRGRIDVLTMQAHQEMEKIPSKRSTQHFNFSKLIDHKSRHAAPSTTSSNDIADSTISTNSFLKDG